MPIDIISTTEQNGAAIYFLPIVRFCSLQTPWLVPVSAAL